MNLTDLPESLLTIRIGSDIYTLNQNDIVRVEANDHKTNIFMKNGSVYSIWMPFSKVVPQLDKNFLTIKRGVAIHMRHVKKWGSQDCEMIDGTQYLLNRSARRQLKEAYFTYKMEECPRAAGSCRRRDFLTVQKVYSHKAFIPISYVVIEIW